MTDKLHRSTMSGSLIVKPTWETQLQVAVVTGRPIIKPIPPLGILLRQPPKPRL